MRATQEQGESNRYDLVQLIKEGTLNFGDKPCLKFSTPSLKDFLVMVQGLFPAFRARMQARISEYETLKRAIHQSFPDIQTYFLERIPVLLECENLLSRMPSDIFQNPPNYQLNAEEAALLRICNLVTIFEILNKLIYLEEQDCIRNCADFETLQKLISLEKIDYIKQNCSDPEIQERLVMLERSTNPTGPVKKNFFYNSEKETLCERAKAVFRSGKGRKKGIATNDRNNLGADAGVSRHTVFGASSHSSQPQPLRQTTAFTPQSFTCSFWVTEVVTAVPAAQFCILYPQSLQTPYPG